LTPSEQKLAAEWLSFHVRQPVVFDVFCTELLAQIRLGRTDYSLKAVLEKVRWHTDVIAAIGTRGINNNFSPFYARLFAARHPVHGHFLEYRAAAADELNFKAILAGDYDNVVAAVDQEEFDF